MFKFLKDKLKKAVSVFSRKVEEEGEVEEEEKIVDQPITREPEVVTEVPPEGPEPSEEEAPAEVQSDEVTSATDSESPLEETPTEPEEEPVVEEPILEEVQAAPQEEAEPEEAPVEEEAKPEPSAEPDEEEEPDYMTREEERQRRDAQILKEMEAEHARQAEEETKRILAEKKRQEEAEKASAAEKEAREKAEAEAAQKEAEEAYEAKEKEIAEEQRRIQEEELREAERLRIEEEETRQALEEARRLEEEIRKEEEKKKGFFQRLFGRKKKEEESLTPKPSELILDKEEFEKRKEDYRVEEELTEAVPEPPSAEPEEKVPSEVRSDEVTSATDSESPLEEVAEVLGKEEEVPAEEEKAEPEETIPSEEEVREVFSKIKEEEEKEEAAQGPEEAVEEAPVEEEPKEKKGLFARIKETFTTVKLSEDKFNDIFWELEVAMLENNVAVEVIEQIKQDLKEELTTGKLKKGTLDEIVAEALRQSILGLFKEAKQFDLVETVKKSGKRPYTVAFIGVNGSGKTTNMAKVAHMLMKNKLSVVFAASDTFRAAAIQQLQEHADKLGVKMIRHDYESDPAAVAFDAIKHAEAKGVDVVLIDTAGRLHTNDNLMNELKKLIRVNKPDLKIFVGESITGNDCVEQAKLFNDAVGIDGIILAKADVDDKGGAAVSVSFVTKKPILYMGVGQTYDDLKRFDAKEMVGHLGL